MDSHSFNDAICSFRVVLILMPLWKHIFLSSSSDMSSMFSWSSRRSSYLSLLKSIFISLAIKNLVKCLTTGASTGIYGSLTSLRMLLMVLSPVTGLIDMKYAICINVLVLNIWNLAYLLNMCLYSMRSVGR